MKEPGKSWDDSEDHPAQLLKTFLFIGPKKNEKKADTIIGTPYRVWRIRKHIDKTTYPVAQLSICDLLSARQASFFSYNIGGS